MYLKTTNTSNTYMTCGVYYGFLYNGRYYMLFNSGHCIWEYPMINQTYATNRMKELFVKYSVDQIKSYLDNVDDTAERVLVPLNKNVYYSEYVPYNCDELHINKTAQHSPQLYVDAYNFLDLYKDGYTDCFRDKTPINIFKPCQFEDLFMGTNSKNKINEFANLNKLFQDEPWVAAATVINLDTMELKFYKNVNYEEAIDIYQNYLKENCIQIQTPIPSSSSSKDVPTINPAS